MNYTILRKSPAAVVVFLFVLVAHAQPPSSEIQDLRRAISEQKKALDEQTRKLGELMDRLDRLEAAQPAATTAAAPAAVPIPLPTKEKAPPAGPEAPTPAEYQRDSVGDMNAEQIRRGDFPGSLLLPGPRGISIGMGGFIKTLGFYDTNAEGREAIFFPSTLGTTRDDIDGGASLTAELTRFNFDARGSVGKARMRGYLEYDLSGDTFKWRHGYLSVDVDSHQLLAGKYWSNFMDLGVLPEGLGEPTLSGAIFSRQAQFRYTRKMARGNSIAVSVEDPASSDIIGAAPVQSRTAFPDLTASFATRGERAHLSVGGLLRRITVDPDGEPDYGATGWGVHIGGHVNLGTRDKIAASFAFGKGVGRYMLGMTPSSGAFVEIDRRTISTRGNLGGLAHLRHQWNSSCRSTAGAGYATDETDPRQPDTAFRASIFGIANYMCTVNRYFTLGFEYNYGRRWNRVGGLDSQRFMFGLQLF